MQLPMRVWHVPGAESMSTAGPDVLEELAPLVAKTGSTLVDAPVVGAPPNVLKGVELVLAGGEPADVDRVRPILERLGEARHVGPFGSGIRPLRLKGGAVEARAVGVP
jgi:3-hydroxyisobutyrate dehydrogenase-like beta-hydroxyacid dehydrogenase